MLPLITPTRGAIAPRRRSPMSVEYRPPTLPRPNKSRHKPQESFSSSLSGGFRTLIVDDNPVNLNILERTLRRHFSHLVSPHIVLANSGNAALCQLSPRTPSPEEEKPALFTSPPAQTQDPPQSPFDLILLDIDMPDISGVQVAEQIRRVHNDQATVIVAVTTSTEPEQQRAYEMAGMDGCVEKPIDLSVLDSVLTRALLSRRPRGRPHTSTVPPISKELVARALEGQAFERGLIEVKEKLSTSTSGISCPPSLNFEDALSRRSSFPLSMGELTQRQESVFTSTLESDYSNDLVKAVSNASLFEDEPEIDSRSRMNGYAQF